MIVFAANAHYTIHSVTGPVKVESGGNPVPAAKGMALKATDELIIPQGARVEVYNDLDKRIYESTRAGKTTVTKLMIEARNIASNNRTTVSSQLRFGKKHDNPDSRVYVEKGMVRRSLAAFDPDGDNLQMDAATLGRYLAAIIAGSHDIGSEPLPVQISHGPTPQQGLAVRVENTLDFPIYFNIIKVSGDSSKEASISQLGQPDGSYVLLPCQSISREHLAPLPRDERHFLVMTHCQYDLDKVTDETNRALAAPDSAAPPGTLPVYVLEL